MGTREEKHQKNQKNCKLYEEEQTGKVREGRKAVPANKMPDLGWDIAETQLQGDWKNTEAREKTESNATHMTLPLQALIAAAIIITTILEHIATHIKEIQGIAKKTVQAVKSTITTSSHNKLLRNIKDSYKTAAIAINIATSMMDHTNQSKQSHTTNGKNQKSLDRQQLNDKYGRSHPSHTSKAPGNTCN